MPVHEYFMNKVSLCTSLELPLSAFCVAAHCPSVIDLLRHWIVFILFLLEQIQRWWECLRSWILSSPLTDMGNFWKCGYLAIELLAFEGIHCIICKVRNPVLIHKSVFCFSSGLKQQACKFYLFFNILVLKWLALL